jgi:hypothetical protein
MYSGREEGLGISYTDKPGTHFYLEGPESASRHFSYMLELISL